jgi:hypothetical protein
MVITNASALDTASPLKRENKLPATRLTLFTVGPACSSPSPYSFNPTLIPISSRRPG